MEDTREHDNWQAVLDGDRTAFNRLVRPHLDELIAAARRELAYHRHRGVTIAFELTPEELVGETLLRAWDTRRKRPEALGLRAWLLGTQHRVLQRLLQRPEWERDLWAISLEDPLPPSPLYDDEESFWEWYQPDDLTRWEDVLPDTDADPEGSLDFKESETYSLDPEERQSLHLHDTHRLTLAEIAYALGTTVEQAVYLLHRAHHHLRARRRSR